MKTVRVIKSLELTLPADRPRCAYCGKLLRPFTVTLAWDEPDKDPPSPGSGHGFFDTQIVEYVQAIRVLNSFGRTGIQVWCGRYQGYERQADGVPLFCKLGCAALFASAAYRAGYRMKAK